MPVGFDYACLGKNEDVRERRYKVFILTLKGMKPCDIQNQTGQTIRQVYNDLLFLRSNPMHNMSVEMLKDIDQSWFAVKITELEQNLMLLTPDSKLWLETQDQIRKYKVELMKLSGVMVEKVEHSGEIGLSVGWDEQDEKVEDSI